MIALDTLDLAACSARFRVLSGSRRQAREALARLRPTLVRLGVARAVLVFVGGGRFEAVWDEPGHPASAAVSGSPTGPRPDAERSGSMPTGPADTVHPAMRSTLEAPKIAAHNSIVHRLELQDGIPTYVARFPHRRESLERIATYTRLALSTHGPLRGHLNFLQLALYEICANSLDHGRPLEAGTEIELGLRLEDAVVTGWIRDHCECFDPLLVALPPLTEHAMNRPRRGYGLHMVLHILDSLTHEHDGTGNRLTFRKEIPS